MKLFSKTFGQGPALIILHGLFGSLDNWVTLGRQLGEHYSVYLVDQRNHGRSPHATDFSYELLAEDLLEFMDLHGIPVAHLLGHSMGGKTVMKFASLYPERIEKMIVLDMATKEYPPHHTEILKGLNTVNPKTSESRQAADEVLKQGIPELGVRQFLLKSLARDGKEGFRWKFNLEVLTEAYPNILESVADDPSFWGPTLFLSGGASHYVTEQDHSDIRTQFPEATFLSLPGVGHWVHAEAPKQFMAAVQGFLGGSV